MNRLIEKWNWGYAIMLVIGCFMTFILVLVNKCLNQKIDLVSASYYEQEIKYDGQIAKERNAQQLDKAVSINYNGERQVVVLSFPSFKESLSGSIHFFKPDNARLDFTVAVASTGGNAQEIPVKNISPGLWHVKVNCQSGVTPYYFEQKVFIN